MSARHTSLVSIAVIYSIGAMAQLDMGPLPTTVWCAGTSIDIPFTASGAFDPGNTFVMEISDASGTFAPGMPIGSLAGTSSGSITCSGMPLTTGPGHLVRVRSTSPAFTSAPGVSSLAFIAPNAGMDGAIAICANGPATDLNAHLVGASAGGTWSDQDATGALVGSLLQPASLLPGSYPFVYMVEDQGCTDSAVFTVVANAALDAGSNAAIVVCSTDPPFAMYQVLGGTPDAGGAWTDPTGQQVSGNFDPATDPSGMYMYVVPGVPPCLSASAALQVMVTQSANAGTNGTATFCPTDTPFQLLQLLGGSPSVGGTWTFAGAPHAAVFIPGTDVPGMYVYTVPGMAPCSNATATLTIAQTSCFTGITPHLDIINATE